MAAAEDALRTWIDALHALTGSPDDAARFREARTAFAVAVAREALRAAGTAKAPAVYGVWLDGHGEPVYVGQTLDAGRRLWDLPIGESHHLANTFPPEIYGSTQRTKDGKSAATPTRQTWIASTRAGVRAGVAGNGAAVPYAGGGGRARFRGRRCALGASCP